MKRTPLKSVAPLRRKSWMRRKPVERAKGWRSDYISTTPCQRDRRSEKLSAWAHVKAIAFARAGHKCVPKVACEGKGLAQHPHHIRAKGMGGSKLYDTLENCLPCCCKCHRWIHEHPEESRKHGWMFSRNGVA